MTTLTPSLSVAAREARPRSRPRLRVKLRITIAVGIVFITVSLAASLVALSYRASAKAVHSFTQELLDPVAASVSERARSFLDACASSASITAELTGETASPGSRLDAADAAGFSLLRAHPELFYVQFGDADGGFQLVQRSPTGSLDSKRVLRDGASITSEWALRDSGAARLQIRERRPEIGDTYDPRLRPWYEGGSRKATVSWTDVYAHVVHGELTPVITAARAVRGRDGTLAGVASAAVSLEGLSTFLCTLRVHNHPARVFIANARGVLIGSSMGGYAAHPGSASPELPKLAEATLPEVAALGQTSVIEDALAAGAGPVVRTYESGGARYMAVVRPLLLEGGRDWIVGAVIPEDDFLGEIKADSLRSGVVSALVILLFTGAGLLLANAIARPLRAIAEETRRLQAFEFDDRSLPESIFEEFAEISHVYANLKTGLRAFEKYVPVKLVRMLLSEGTEVELGGRIEELTIFFSDIRDFSTFAEAQEPDMLAARLGRYLHVMAETIAAHRGTVDKFIGDAVMAFWNAPRAVDDHAYHGVIAAIRCRDAIRKLGDGHALYTRMGLHTARAVVGNFGAPERFAYTALGDSVNLASRLEGANKEYGTQILISEETYERVRGRVVCRRIDRIAVKGRSKPTEIYEVLGETATLGAPEGEAAKVFGAALDAYFARDFAGAARLFEDAGERRPGDRAAAVMRARSERYRDAPPPADWTGVFTLSSK